MWDLAPWSGIESVPPEVEVQEYLAFFLAFFNLIIFFNFLFCIGI